MHVQRIGWNHHPVGDEARGPEGETWVPTGETYGDFWKRATLHEKGADLCRISVKVDVDTRKPADDNPVRSGRLRLEAPSDWLRWGFLEKPKRKQKTDWQQILQP